MGKKRERITVSGKAALQALVEHSLEWGARKRYPQQPFLHGYELISFEPAGRYACQTPLTEQQKNLVARFAERPWSPTRAYLRDLKSLLVQRAKVQNPDTLTWDDILSHIAIYLQKPTAASGSRTGNAGQKKTALRLDKARSRVWLSGKWQDLSEAQCKMLSILVKGKGAWIAGKAIGERPDKTRKRMPKAVGRIIQTHQTHGYRIKTDLFV